MSGGGVAGIVWCAEQVVVLVPAVLELLTRRRLLAVVLVEARWGEGAHQAVGQGRGCEEVGRVLLVRGGPGQRCCGARACCDGPLAAGAFAVAGPPQEAVQGAWASCCSCSSRPVRRSTTARMCRQVKSVKGRLTRSRLIQGISAQPPGSRTQI
jgi:hypothetical protein